MVYQVKALGKDWVLTNKTIRRHVPGVLEYPAKRSRQLRLPSRATIDIGRIVTKNVFVNHDMISLEQYDHCLNELMDSIEETEASRSKDQNPLLNVLDTALERHRGNMFAMLHDFFCFADLVQKANLGGSQELLSDLSTFFIRHAGRICRSLPLNQSLQFVDMCPNFDFEACMERLLVKLPSKRRYELKERRGKVGLYFKRRPSDKIKRFMRGRADPNRTPTPSMMASYPPPPRNGLPINQRGRRRLLDRPSNTIGPVTRSISAEKLLERGVNLYEVAQNGGRVTLPGRGPRSPSQGPSRRYRYQRAGRGDGWFGG